MLVLGFQGPEKLDSLIHGIGKENSRERNAKITKNRKSSTLPIQDSFRNDFANGSVLLAVKVIHIGVWRLAFGHGGVSARRALGT